MSSNTPAPLGALADCTDCDLCKTGKTVLNSVIPEGKVTIVFVGEAPGREEESRGELFADRAGRTFKDCLVEAGIDPNQVAYIDAVRHRPGTKNGKQQIPNLKQIAACRKYLQADLDYLKPNIICALGTTAIKAVHRTISLASVRGAPFICQQFGIKTIATNHPLAVAQGYALKDTFISDLKKVLEESKTPNMPEEDSTYYSVIEPETCGSEEQALEDLQELKDYLLSSEEFSFDVETLGVNYHEDAVLCIGFSTQPGEGIVVPLIGQFEEVKHCKTPAEALKTLGIKKGTPSRVWSDEALLKVREVLKEILESSVPKIAQNGKFDWHMAKYQLDATLKNFAYDDLLAHHSYHEERPHDLEHLRGLETTMPAYDLELHEWAPTMNHSFALAPNHVLWRYNACDCDCEFRLKARTYKKLRKESRWSEWIFREIAMPLQRSFVHMEEVGAPVDVEHLANLGKHFAGKIISLDAEMRKMLRPLAVRMEQLRRDAVEQGYDSEDLPPLLDLEHPKLFTSTQKLWSLLYEYMSLPQSVARDIRAKPDSKPSTDVKALNRLTLSPKVPKGKKAFLNLLLDFRQARKLKSSFVGGGASSKAVALVRYIRRDGRLHSNFNVHGTDTGRISSSSPNLHNIPGDSLIRNIIKAPDGHWLLDSDFSQIEPRALAYLSGDNALLEDLCSCECGESFITDYDGFDVHLKKSGHKRGDVHTNMAVRVFGLPPEEINRDIRMQSKTVVLGANYGRGAKSLAAGLSMTDKQAEELLSNYFARYHGVYEFRQTQEEFLDRYQATFSALGRMRHFPEWTSLREKEKARKLRGDDFSRLNHIRRQIINTPCQSSGSDILSLSTIALSDWEGVEWALDGLIEMPLVHTLMKERFGEYPALLMKNDYGSLPFLSVHDSLIMMAPDAHVEETKDLVEQVMKAVPRDVMANIEGPYGTWSDGWYAPVSVKVSRAWGGDEHKDIEKGVNQWTRLQSNMEA